MTRYFSRREMLAGLLASAATTTTLFAQDKPKPKAAKDRQTGAGQAKPPVNVTISKDTTHITEPLRPDGYPDYVAALNKRFSQGVTPENNSAVLFLQAIGPGDLGDAAYRARYFQMLGIPPLPEKGDYLIDLDKYVDASEGGKAGGNPQAVQERHTEAWNKQATACGRPWSKSEFPLLAGWLEANAKPLALVVEASRRPRRYDPLIAASGESAFAILLGAVQQSRGIVRAMVPRAMLRAGEGDLDGAWQDLLTCHRSARLVNQGAYLVEAMVALTIDGITRAADQALLRHVKLSPSRVAKMREDLARLPPMPSMADKIDFGERIGYLDAITAIARGDTRALSETGYLGQNSSAPDKGLMSLLSAVTAVAIDWNAVLQIGNSWYDRLVAACRKPSRRERKAALGKIYGELNTLAKSVKDPASLAKDLFVSPRAAVSERCGQFFVALLLPACMACADAEDRNTMQSDLNTLAFALAACRADHGSYPKKLAELVPTYLPSVPKDIFDNDADLRYKLTDNGYLLYSVGRNGKDDDAKTMEDRYKSTPPQQADWDDLVVKMPDEDMK